MKGRSHKVAERAPPVERLEGVHLVVEQPVDQPARRVNHVHRHIARGDLLAHAGVRLGGAQRHQLDGDVSAEPLVEAPLQQTGLGKEIGAPALLADLGKGKPDQLLCRVIAALDLD